jgi:hypothetical protein
LLTAFVSSLFCTDPFGNYLFSKLVEHCDTQQLDQIVKKITPELLQTAFDMYGTQSLQKMMPFLSESQVRRVLLATFRCFPSCFRKRSLPFRSLFVAVFFSFPPCLSLTTFRCALLFVCFPFEVVLRSCFF